MITSPVFHTYSDNIDIEKYNIMQEKIKYLSECHRIEYYNYFFDERFTEEDFLNDDHLNNDGAEKFSKIISNEIINTIYGYKK